MPLQAQETNFKGLYVVNRTRLSDERGYFDGLFIFNFFKEQCEQKNPLDRINLSFNNHRGTVRGLHRQKLPYNEAKIVTCLQGSLFDVAVDLRAESATYGQHFCIELSEENCTMLYIPTGFAHGFQTLTPNTKMLYFVDNHYSPQNEEVFNALDPAFNIAWPLAITKISKRDSKAQFIRKIF